MATPTSPVISVITDLVYSLNNGTWSSVTTTKANSAANGTTTNTTSVVSVQAVDTTTLALLNSLVPPLPAGISDVALTIRGNSIVPGSKLTVGGSFSFGSIKTIIPSFSVTVPVAATTTSSP